MFDFHLHMRRGEKMSDYNEYYKQAWEQSLMKSLHRNEELHNHEMAKLRDVIEELKYQNGLFRQALEYVAHHESLPEGQREYHNKVATEALKGKK
jgi:hypothetical protein